MYNRTERIKGKNIRWAGKNGATIDWIHNTMEYNELPPQDGRRDEVCLLTINMIFSSAVMNARMILRALKKY